MTTKIWRGDAADVAQVNTITPANVNIGNTFTVTINQKDITFTATAGTVANVTAGLVALLSASTIPEFAEITWVDSSTLVTATATTAGKPFTQTSSASGGTATLVTATTVANASKNDWGNAANWSPSGVPVSTDDVFVQNTTVSILYGLSQSAVTLTSLNILSSFTGEIGLAMYTGTYFEYRPTQLAISATTINIGQGLGAGSGRLKINTGSVQTTVNVFGTAAGAEAGMGALVWRGTHASNVVNIYRGSMDVAAFPGETATIATLRVGYQTNVAADVSLRLGTGVTLTTINQSGGDLTIQSNVTTINKTDGILSVLGTATVTTLNNDGGTVFYATSGTLTTLNNGGGATVDATRDMRARTFTTTNLHAGCTLNDPFATITFTNGYKTVRCTNQDVTVNVGNDRTYTPS